jgi:hypothetical protein
MSGDLGAGDVGPPRFRGGDHGMRGAPSRGGLVYRVRALNKAGESACSNVAESPQPADVR